MTPKFFRLQLAALDKPIAINASDVRAVLPLGEDKYQVWLSADLKVSSEIGKRLAKLAGVTPLGKDSWEVRSSDLDALFKE